MTMCLNLNITVNNEVERRTAIKIAQAAEAILKQSMIDNGDMAPGTTTNTFLIGEVQKIEQNRGVQDGAVFGSERTSTAITGWAAVHMDPRPLREFEVRIESADGDSGTGGIAFGRSEEAVRQQIKLKPGETVTIIPMDTLADRLDTLADRMAKHIALDPVHNRTFLGALGLKPVDFDPTYQFPSTSSFKPEPVVPLGGGKRCPSCNTPEGTEHKAGCTYNL